MLSVVIAHGGGITPVRNVSSFCPIGQILWLKLDIAIRSNADPTRLVRLSRTEIESALGVCKRYAYEIASGEKMPHPRHWMKLAELVGIQSAEALAPE